MRRFLTLLLSLILVLTLFTGAACTKKGDSSQQESVKPEPPALEIITRDDVVQTVETNVNMISLMDTYLLYKGNNQLVKKVFNGVVVGDFMSKALDGIIMVGYGSDGNWYVTADPYNPTKFNAVMNAIFNYQIASGKPLALSQIELTLYGGQKLINVFGTQFGIYNIDSMLTEILPATSAPFIQRMLGMTVNDLYALSSGDYTYVENFIEQTHPDEIINLVFDMASLLGYSLPKTQATLVDLIEYDEYGLFINEDVLVGDILASLEEMATFAGVENADAMFEDLEMLLGEETSIGEVVNVLMEIEFDVIVDSFAKAFVELYPNDATLIDEIFATFKAKADGKIGELVINEQNVSVWIDDVIAKVEDQALVASLEAVSDLLYDITVEDILHGFGALLVDDVIDTLATIASVNTPENAQLIEDVMVLLQKVFDGTIESLQYNPNLYVSELLVSVNDIINNFVVNDILDEAFKELEALYDHTTLGSLNDDTMALDIDCVITSSVSVLSEAIEDAEGLRELEEILCNLLDGTIGEPIVDESYLQENGNKTLNELVGEYFTSINETEMQKFLNLTLKDIVSLVEGELTQNAISVLDSISYFEVVDYLTR
ncbi:MAG: hypothetical protein IKJ19_07040 [Clostridia bacterium]|nr:hypothetical protein [Clostridia bacterium]